MPNAQYGETGGAWFPNGDGTIALTWPFVKLDLTASSIRIYAASRLSTATHTCDVRIDRSILKEIKHKRLFPLIADGIEIAIEGQAKPLTFWSFHSRRLIRQLKTMGYHVIESA